MALPEEDITQLLARVQGGDELAGEALFTRIYDRLHALAHNYMRRERADHTLQPTALVNEAFIKLGGGKEVDWESRSHFFRFAAQAMRCILIDYSRKRRADKNPAHRDRAPLVDDLVLVGEFSYDILALNDALEGLAKKDEQMARIVELRFFGGLTVEEAAKVLKVSPRTVKGDWRMAKAWLKKQMDTPPS